MNNGNITTLFGFQILKRMLIRNELRTTYKIVLFKLFMMSIGYSTFEGENIHIVLGFTKLEIFTSFTIKKRWLRWILQKK